MHKPPEIGADKESSAGLNPDATGRSNHNKVLEAGLSNLPVQGTGVVLPRCGISENDVLLPSSSAQPYFREQLSAWQSIHLNPEEKQNRVLEGVILILPHIRIESLSERPHQREHPTLQWG